MLGRTIWMLVARRVNPAKPTLRVGGSALYLYDPAQPRTSVLVTCIGLSDADLPGIVAAAEQTLKAYDIRVYLTDTDNFSPFLKIGAKFEYVPPGVDQSAYLPGAPWKQYLRERYTVILAKWAPSVIVSYGTPIDHFIS